MKKSTNRSNQVFISTVIVSIVFVFLPVILRIPGWKGSISGYLAPLGEQKASYIETCGAILGSFLAITSSIWLQNRSDIASKNSEIRERALVIYYDFYFAIKEIGDFWKSFHL